MKTITTEAAYLMSSKDALFGLKHQQNIKTGELFILHNTAQNTDWLMVCTPLSPGDPRLHCMRVDEQNLLEAADFLTS